MSLEFKYDKTGVFKSEIKNRFRALVDIDGDDTVCYIQSSSRLSNYIKLQGEEVYLHSINANKLHYTVMAKRKKHDYMLLCPSMANDIVYSEIDRRLFSFLGNRRDAIKEHTVEGYKSDIFLPKQKYIIEIKALLSEKNKAIFPTVYSERTLHQLDRFERFILDGYKIAFMIISFNPYIDEIALDQETEFYKKIINLIRKGLILKAYSVTSKNGAIKIKKEIKII